MPWNECSVMDKRLRFVARLLDREADVRALPGVRHLAQDRLRDLRALQGAWARGLERPLAPAGALRQPEAAPVRSASSSSGSIAISAFPPRVRSTPSCTGTGWSRFRAGRAIAPTERRSRPERRPTISGLPISKGSSSSATGNTVPPSPITPRASSCSAKRSNRPARTSPSPPSSSSSASAACAPISSGSASRRTTSSTRTIAAPSKALFRNTQ